MSTLDANPAPSAAEGQPEEDLLVEVRDALAVVTLNRPKARNAINDDLRERLLGRLKDLEADPAIRVVILTGAGTAFCAGGDVKGMQSRLDAPVDRIAYDGWRRQKRTAAFVSTLRGLGQITIAAVNGPAMGLGMDVALACDFIVAAPEAVFGSSFVRRGLIPDGGSMYLLPRRIGLQRAKELMYSGRTVDAEEALRLGLADRLAEPGRLMESTFAFAEQFLENSGPAISLMKSIVDRSFETPLDGVAQLGGEAQAICYTTAEHRASVQKFVAR